MKEQNKLSSKSSFHHTHCKTLRRKFWEKVDVNNPDGCWKWTGRELNGYGYLDLRCSGGRPMRAHRISWLLHRGDIPEGMLVCHKCDNKLCVRPDHLFIGTAGHNLWDDIGKGRWERARAKGKRIGRPWTRVLGVKE